MAGAKAMTMSNTVSVAMAGQRMEATVGMSHCDGIELSDPSVDCACNAIYEVGDIVIATVDSPSGASGVMAGDTGVVVCGTTYDPTIHFVGCMGWLGPRP